MQDVLSNELRIIIEIRNKLAHGQWVYPLNSEGTAVESDKYELINKENLQSLQQKLNLLKHLASVIHDLVVSQTTFERDFEKHFQGVSQARINLKTKDYDKYKAQLVQRKRDASTKRSGS